MAQIATAAALRAYFQADERRMARLTPAEAKTVSPGARGRVHPGAVAKARGFAKTYQTGATKAAVQAAKDQAASLRAEAAKAGYSVGKRGPLPKAFVQSLTK